MGREECVTVDHLSRVHGNYSLFKRGVISWLGYRRGRIITVEPGPSPRGHVQNVAPRSRLFFFFSAPSGPAVWEIDRDLDDNAHRVYIDKWIIIFGPFGRRLIYFTHLEYITVDFWVTRRVREDDGSATCKPTEK